MQFDGRKSSWEMRSPNTGDTPIHIAAKFGALQCMNALISANVNVSPVNLNGESPLYLAEKNQNECFGILKALGAQMHPSGPSHPNPVAQGTVIGSSKRPEWMSFAPKCRKGHQMSRLTVDPYAANGEFAICNRCDCGNYYKGQGYGYHCQPCARSGGACYDLCRNCGDPK